MQLQRSLPELTRRGLGLVAISYDPPATLRAFADQRGITFPMLSDPGSAVIRRYGILNAEAEGRSAGIPHPGTFVVDPRGVVVSRAFEAAYQERSSVANIVQGTVPGVSATRAETQHVTVAASASDGVVTPGSRISLFVDITPKPKMHVYAPDQSTYIPVAIEMPATDLLRTHPAVFPPSEIYVFRPLNERQRVYSKPFRIVQEVTIPVTPETRAQAKTGTLTIDATLHYQACDDAVCYRPVSVPLTWTVKMDPLAR